MSHHKSNKIRKESGRIYNKHYDPENGAYNTVHWNDWIDTRDGMRRFEWDSTKSSKSRRISRNKRQRRNTNIA